MLAQKSQSERVKEIQEMIEDNENRLKLLQSSGIKEVKVWQKFKIANLESDYEMLYAHLCTRTHGNRIALISRYISLSEDKASYQINLYPPSNADLEAAKCSFLLYLLKASIFVHDFFKTNQTDTFENLVEELKNSNESI